MEPWRRTSSSGPSMQGGAITWLIDEQGLKSEICELAGGAGGRTQAGDTVRDTDAWTARFSMNFGSEQLGIVVQTG